MKNQYINSFTFNSFAQGNPQNCKGVTDKAAFDAICAADWTDNFEGEGLWTWDPTANPPATYCKKMPSCFCELCSDKVSGGENFLLLLSQPN